ncbi:hypothetical protein BD414DRAFT_329457 [Trametes punicea]|nr:hypothetical protein BD414DRAFT_329457 [Trametes punicea]
MSRRRTLLDDSSDEEYNEELDDIAHIAAAVLTASAEEARLRRAEARLHNRRYLCRPQLLPNPRESTPWQALYHSQNDRAFITTMGIDCATFQYILDSGFAHRWNTTPIPRPDVHATGEPRLGRRSLDAAGALSLVYHYLTSAMSDTALQQIFALVPATVARYRSFGLRILRDTLRQLPEAQVLWWSSVRECEEDAELIRMIRNWRTQLTTGGCMAITPAACSCSHRKGS